MEAESGPGLGVSERMSVRPKRTTVCQPAIHSLVALYAFLLPQ